jgi:hypothetical protein
MPAMRIVLPTLLFLAAACVSRVPAEGRVTSEKHTDYASIRPVVIAILRTDGDASRIGLRRLVYERLPDKRYSPLQLDVVDAHTDSKGKFEAADLDWDATLRLEVDDFRARGGALFRADATARLVHRTGEQIWSCSVAGYPLAEGFEESAQMLAKVLLGHLDDCPPLPR